MSDELLNLDTRPDYEPCGCLINTRGAHRGDCPDYETVCTENAPTSNRLDDLSWKRREGR